MDSQSNVRAATILCVEPDLAVVETRCAVLKYSGYDATSASPRVAETVLRSRGFDLIVLSGMHETDLHRIVNLADGAGILVLEELTPPDQLLLLVAQQLNRRLWRA
jgi:hypothetical protein